MTRWPVQHRARRALGHACHSRVFPARLGTSPLQRDPRYLGKLGLLSCLPRGFNCSAHSHNLPLHPHQTLTARPCPEDTRLEWHLKAPPKLPGGRAGGRRWLRWQLDPKPSGEGFTRFLLFMLKADSALLTHNFNQNYIGRRSVLCVAGVHFLCYQRDQGGILFSKSSLTTT